jgi:DNA-binding NarL/FixJ family response regulator
MERALIADDHPLVRDGLRTVLLVTFDSCELFEASTVDEALAIVEREGDFDLVLLDLNMPGMENLAGLRTMRERFPSLPVVIVSGSTDRAQIASAMAAGAAGFVPKSMRRSAIVAALKTVLEGGVYTPDDLGTVEPGTDAEAGVRARIATLTPAQKVVLQRLVAGRLNKEVAWELGISMTTVKAHVSAILAKLQVFSRTQAVILANRVGFLAGEVPDRPQPRRVAG